jgi:hypothetical protein
MAQRWYYTRQGEQVGPVREEEIRAILASAQLAPAELIWREGTVERLSPEIALKLHLSQPTGSVHEGLADEPPPFPPTVRGNKTHAPGRSQALDEPPPFPPTFPKIKSQQEIATESIREQEGLFKPAAFRPTPAESGGRNPMRLLIVIAGSILALLAVMAVLAVSFYGLDGNHPSKIKFAVDGKMVKIRDTNVFDGDPKICIGDPPPQEWGAIPANGTVSGQWPTGVIAGLLVTYVFRNNELSDVSLRFWPEAFETAVKVCSAKFGPPHHVSQPTFTTIDGTIHQNQAVSWETDAGLFELGKFDVSMGGTTWRDWGYGKLVRESHKSSQE